jgi:hypothetical protein
VRLADTAALLRERWNQPRSGLATTIKYIGLFGAVLAGFGLFGMALALTHSFGFAGIMSMGAGFLGLHGGLRLWGDPLARYAMSCNVVIALGVLCFVMGLGLLCAALDVSLATGVVVTGALSLPIVFGLAYRYRNAFLLTLGLLGVFHWIGAWQRMLGRSVYAFAVSEPRAMACAALAAVAVGLWHVRTHVDQGPRFHLCYEVLGLVYFNQSLLICTIHTRSTDALFYILVWAAAGVAQLVMGARLQRPLYTAFGVTVLAVNLYTRFYERFWDALDAGIFFLLGGLSLFAAGALCEWRQRRARPA